MKTSVAVTKAGDVVTERLSEADKLLIIDEDEMSVVKIILQERPEGRDVEFANQTVEYDCEAIICGKIDKEAFDIIADAGVSRYLGTGSEALKSIKLMQAYKLPLIREYDGGSGCRGAEIWRKTKCTE